MTNEKKEVFLFDELDTKTAADAGVEVEIMKADGDSSGMFIKVLGTDSIAYQRLREKYDRQRLKLMQKSGRNATDLVLDQARKHDLDLAAECTLAWRHVSKEMPFDVKDKDQLIDFYVKYPLVYDQVRISMHDRALFTMGSAKP